MTYTTQELLAVSASRLLKDRKVVFAGVGMPLLASVLAKSVNAPHLTIVLEGGIIGPQIQPGEFPVSTNEMRGARRSVMLTDIADVFLFGQRGFFDYGFLGTAQIDKYGNLNTSVIGEYDNPKVRLPGTGGANDIASSCRHIFVVTTHEKRRFVDQVDFVTSPGHRLKDGREGSGPVFGTIERVVTDLAIMDFDPETKRMRVKQLQPGRTMEEVRSATGFELMVEGDGGEAEPPTVLELDVLRGLDPDRQIIGGARHEKESV